jgi:dihydrofolate synthase / folylpolyglutamate synthase
MNSTFHHLEEVEAFLNEIPMFGQAGPSAANFNLDRMRSFCAVMGNPQNQFRSVHVAGTNGKGTVCRMLASVYQMAGYKTGIYTSPHLTDVRERFRINGIEITPEAMILFFNSFADYIRKTSCTYFEITTAIAFWYFAREKTEIAIIETGLGGRLDATNVIDPEISVITSIGMDHTDLLGNSYESIAFEKGGIIKKGVPVVLGDLNREANTVIRNIARGKQSEIISAIELNPVYEDGKIWFQAMHPSVDIDARSRKKIDAVNAAIVFKAVACLSGQFPVTGKMIIAGIEQMNKIFPKTGTFERLIPQKKWYFDGGHNPDAVHHITCQMLLMAPPGHWSVVLSFLKDKLNRETAGIWNQFPELFLYRMDSQRAASIDEMKAFFPGAKTISKDELIHENQFKTELVIFSGSFYFYTTVSKWMGTMIATENKSFRTR